MSINCSGAQPLVSLIIPFYQTAAYLPDCLDSVLAQSYPHLEVILVDNGSTDGSAVIAKAYAERDSRVRVVRSAQPGDVSAARNTGLDAAQGAWIGWADSDDIILPDTVNILLSTALNANVNMAMGAYTECHAGTMPFNRFVSAPAGVWRGAEEVQRYFLTKAQFLNHLWTKLYRREVFANVRFTPGLIYEDMDIMPRAAEAAGSVATVNRSVYRYQVRRASLSTSVNLRKQMDGLTARMNYVSFMEQHHPDLVPLAKDGVLLFGLNMMGKIQHIGIENAQAEWDDTIRIMREYAQGAALQNPVYKAGYSLFKNNPRFLARCVHMGLKLDRML